MGGIEELLSGLRLFLGVKEVLLAGVGVLLGITIGVLPGIGPLLGVILLTPFCLKLSPVAGMSMLIGVYVGGSYGGAISAALIRIPGTPIAAATLLEAYPMAQKGRASEAVGLATSASALGGLIGGVFLIIAAPQLARVALKFNPPEIFALTFIGLTCIAAVSKGSTAKGLIAGGFGLIIAMMGTDPFTGYDRFTFGNPNLTGGIRFVALLVGLFAISEMFIQIEKGLKGEAITKKLEPMWSSLKDVLSKPVNLIRSSLIGVGIGAIPGVGAVTSSYISYSAARSASEHPEKFGTGVPEGVVATEAANNATCGGALIPALALGIPGDPITAVLIGALMLQGLLPGPQLFKLHIDIVYGLFIAYIVCNVFLWIIGTSLAPLWGYILRTKKNILMPVIILLSILGTYAVQMSMFDIWSMWIFGVVGYAMRKTGFPLAPLVIARILGPIVEPAFRRSMMFSGGDITIFLTRPISLVFVIIVIIILTWPLFKFLLKGDLRKKKIFSS